MSKTMTRKDYDLVAMVLRNCNLARLDKKLLVEDFCAQLERDNPERFNSERFTDACYREREKR